MYSIQLFFLCLPSIFTQFFKFKVQTEICSESYIKFNDLSLLCLKKSNDDYRPQSSPVTGYFCFILKTKVRGGKYSDQDRWRVYLKWYPRDIIRFTGHFTEFLESFFTKPRKTLNFNYWCPYTSIVNSFFNQISVL